MFIIKGASMPYNLLIYIYVSLLLTSFSSANAFEHTKVLPKGVRNVTLKSVRTTIKGKTSSQGVEEPIAKPLEKNLTLEKVINGETGLKKNQLHALIISEGLKENDSLGSFHADMVGSVAVTAPIFSYGFTERFTLALAVPFYQANMKVSSGFKVNRETTLRLLSSLKDKNQIKEANEMIAKLNNAVGELNNKLTNNNFRELRDWEGSGVGDITLAAKYKPLETKVYKFSVTGGMVVPSGETKSPYILTDIPFGKGTYDAFSMLANDEYITEDLFLNQFIKYTHHLKGKHDFRLATEEEAIEVGVSELTYQLGDRIDTGVSMQYEPDSGLVAGLGLVFEKKYSDRYMTVENVSQKLEKNTEKNARYLEAKIAFSTVKAFKKQKFPVPLTASLEFKKHLASINSTTNDYMTVDIALFF